MWTSQAIVPSSAATLTDHASLTRQWQYNCHIMHTHRKFHDHWHWHNGQNSLSSFFLRMKFCKAGMMQRGTPQVLHWTFDLLLFCLVLQCLHLRNVSWAWLIYTAYETVSSRYLVSASCEIFNAEMSINSSGMHSLARVTLHLHCDSWPYACESTSVKRSHGSFHKLSITPWYDQQPNAHTRISVLLVQSTPGRCAVTVIWWASTVNGVWCCQRRCYIMLQDQLEHWLQHELLLLEIWMRSTGLWCQ